MSDRAVGAWWGIPLLAVFLAAGPPPGRYEYDRASKDRSGLKESDVCLSCRFRSEGRSPEEAVRTWQPTRLEWTYIRAPAFLEFVRTSEAEFVGALNTIEHDGPQQDGERLDGGRMVAPWMTSFNNGRGVGWACVNKPATLATRIQTLKTYTDQRVLNIQFDDWKSNLSAYGWGGCFCPECLQGFATYLTQHATAEDLKQAGVQSCEGFNYREHLKTRFGWTTPKELVAGRSRDPLDRHFRMFQLLASRGYFDRLLAAGQRMAGEPIRLSVNANLRHPADFFLVDQVDYCVGETPLGGESELWDVVHTLKLCDALRLPQVMSPRPTAKETDVRTVRRAIAAVYALGHRMLIPWDVWNFDNPRWFGTPEEYGDFYGFVRQSAHLLDGYRPWSDVVLAVPLSSDRRQCDKTTAAALKMLQSLTKAGYLCRYAAYGDVGEVVHIPVAANDFDGAAVIIRMAPGPIAEADGAVLKSALAKTGATVLPENQASPEALRKILAPSARSNPADLLVLPRAKPGDRTAPLVVHLVNLKNPIERGSLWLSRSVVDGQSIARATLRQPGRPETNLSFEQSKDGISVDLFGIDVWGLVELR